MKFLFFWLTVSLLVSFAPVGLDKDDPANAANSTNWPTYGGNPAGNRYSTLTQINRQTVKNLQLAWTFDTGDHSTPGGRSPDLQCQPIVVNGIMYGTTPRLKLFAIDAATGEKRWLFDPFAAPGKQPRFHPVRGVTYWADGTDQRILYSVGATLYAINAQTGQPIDTFGKGGEVDLHEGLGDQQTLGYDVNTYNIRSTTPGVIFRDLLIMGSSVSEGGDALPGHIRAFNVRTGKLAWVFRTIPLPGEYGYDTWAKDSYKKLGGANCWAGMVVDEKRGVVYAGTGSPSVDFYGGARPGKNLFANCVIAINAATGKRIWHFQTVHHDLWDRDIPCPPNLMRVKHNGPDGRPRMVDAVAQVTKDGYVFVFDRDTGKPLFPVKEVPVPTSPALPGEHPWPTQPVPTKPAPFCYQDVTEAMLTSRTPEARAYVLDRFKNSRRSGKWVLPSQEGSLIYGMGGGAEWGGTAASPDGILYVNSNNMLWWLKMRDARESPGVALTKGASLFNTNCAVCHGLEGKPNASGADAYPDLRYVAQRLTRDQVRSLLATGRGRMPSFSHLSPDDRDALINFLFSQGAQVSRPVATSVVSQTASAVVDIHSTSDRGPGAATAAPFPYRPPFLNNGNQQFRDLDNYPALKTPWGTLNAIDLNTGRYVWQVPLGEYPELAEKGLSNTGTENHGGPLVTAGGLLFIAATYDQHLRAFDQQTGKVVWQTQLPAGGFATPITYAVAGRQYVVIAAGGARYGLPGGSTYVAYALPPTSK